MTRVGGAIVAAAVLAALFGPALSPFDPSDQQLALRRKAPNAKTTPRTRSGMHQPSKAPEGG